MTREEAIKALNEYGTLFPSDKSEAIDIAIEALQTDIVHCEECKHWKDYECYCESASTDHEGGASYSLDRDGNDYCSFGERSEE